MAVINEHIMAKPFDKAVEYFRKKLNIPASRWDDLWKEQHAMGFMVAGAMKAELLADFREAINAAIVKGESLQDFRSRFDDIVDKYGWNYTGNRNWRTKVIYNTNMRTAYMAGRYKQMKDPDVTALRPYWQYRHGDSRNPRLQHLAWHGMVLRHDDPWWDTHYPPSGFGCRCRVVTMSQRDLDKRGLKPEKAPDLGTYEWTDKDGNVHKIPTGIDPGWDYNVGQASERSFKILANKFETMPNDVARKWMGEYIDSPVFEHFFKEHVVKEFPVSVLRKEDQEVLGTSAQTVWLSKETLEEHKEKHPEISIEAYRRIPEILDEGEVYKSGDTRLVYIKLDGKWYRAILKKTKDGSENYFLSLFTTGARKTERQVRESLERVR